MLLEWRRLQAPLKNGLGASAFIQARLGFYGTQASRRGASRRDRHWWTVTYSAGVNLIDMRRNIFLLALGLACVVATSRAQGSSNHLSGQPSPYLKRAVSQPVDWYPWGPEAFRRASELNRPILLDVGAVWCPWCGLMDRDTYTNATTADYINQHFVSVKVDFDSAPELVAQLHRAQAVLNLPAGLPLTSFITPDGKLYFGAGYLPVEHKVDKPSFREAAEEALKRYADGAKIEEESFQLEVARKP
jgi:thiol:disulfide interchange protein